jgi:nitrogen fixation NifU-like protein
VSDLRDLYQEVILDHSRRPRNFGVAQSATGSARGDNPLCGDKVLVTVEVQDGTVRDVRFEGKGCAISTASASLMTESVRGKTVAEAEALFHRFHGVVTAPPDAELDLDDIGKLAALAGVREYPMRVKCASLAWHTLKAALQGKPDPVSTE